MPNDYKLSAHSTILRTTAETTLKQKFLNISQAGKECIYMFPLFDGVSVVGFTCQIGDRTIHGVVKERRKAKAMYAAAKSRGEITTLLEQLPEAADVFSMKLGNIPAGGDILVEISYVSELKHDAETDGTRFTLPIAIAPRYDSKPRNVVAGKGAREDGIDITVDVSVGESSLIQSVQSPSHPIIVSVGKNSTSRHESQLAMHQASATLALGATHLSKDFVLVVSSSDNGLPTALLEAHSSIPKQRALMVDLVPRFNLSPARPEIIFLVDRSGSMAREIPILKSAVKVFLKSLPVRAKFNICSFGSTHSFLWPKSRSYDSDSLKEAVAHVEDFAPNYGGTEIQNAMKAAIDSRFADLDCEILLLTDGDIWRQQEMFNYLNDTVGNEIRVFSLGIGGSVSSSLIEGVARAGKGFAQMVGEGEKFENKVVRMMKGALSPHVSDYTMEVKYEKSTDEEDDATWEMVEKVTDGLKVMLTEQMTPPKTRKEHQKAISLFDSSIKTEEKEYPLLLGNENENPYADLPDVSTPKLLQTPHQLPPLYPFARTTAYLLLSPGSAQRTPKSVVLRGTSRQGPLYLEIPIQKLPESGRKIHQLAAKKAMQELEEGRGWIYDAKDSESGRLLKDLYPSCLDEIIQREAVRLGVQFQVGGKWCSFVGVSEDVPLGMKPSEDDIQNIEPPVPGSASSFDGSEFYASEGIECFEAEAEEAEESDEDMGSGFFDSSPLRTITPVNGAHRGRGDHSTLLPSQNRGTTTRSTPSPGLFGSISGCPHRGSQNIKYKQSSRSPPTKTGSTMASFSSTASAGLASRSGAAVVKSGFKAASSTQRNNKPVATDSDKVLSIIELQDFEGFWTDVTELASIMGVKEKVLSNKKESYWITLVVIAFLENKMDKEKETWDLVVCKARTWLEENEFQMEVLEAEARQVVQHGK